MKSIADQLPPEIASQVHPDWRKNEADYWAVRGQLLAQYQNRWIGFANGKVIVAGTSPVEVFHAAQESGLHPFFICVGREDEPSRIRRAAFVYDAQYPGEALPIIEVEFRQAAGTSGVVLDRVIPDTGSDSSVLPWRDWQRLQLSASAGAPGFMSGITGSPAATIAFQLFARVDGQDLPCRVQADFVGNERIVGRDVLNRLEVLFRGPAGEVVVNP